MLAGVVNPLVFVPMLPLVAVFYCVRSFYIKSSREVRNVIRLFRGVIRLFRLCAQPFTSSREVIGKHDVSLIYSIDKNPFQR